MSLTREQLLTEALSLDPTEREALAEELLLSLDEPDREAIDAAWLAESRSRDAAFRRGEIQGVPVDDAIARILAKARP